MSKWGEHSAGACELLTRRFSLVNPRHLFVLSLSSCFLRQTKPLRHSGIECYRLKIYVAFERNHSGYHVSIGCDALCLFFWIQAHILSVHPRGGAGQRPRSPPCVFWGGRVLRGHQGGLQTSSKPRGGVSVCLLQDSDWRPVPQLALTAIKKLVLSCPNHVSRCLATAVASQWE